MKIFSILVLVGIVLALSYAYGIFSKREKHSMIVALTIIEAKKVGDTWSVVAGLTFKNEGDAAFQLESLTAGRNGEIANDIFDIRSGDKRVEYVGIVKKRAAPRLDGFITLRPGELVQNNIQLDRYYQFPEGGGTFTITFESFNHFSKDAVTLKSNTATFVLEP